MCVSVLWRRQRHQRPTSFAIDGMAWLRGQSISLIHSNKNILLDEVGIQSMGGIIGKEKWCFSTGKCPLLICRDNHHQGTYRNKNNHNNQTDALMKTLITITRSQSLFLVLSFLYIKHRPPHQLESISSAGRPPSASLDRRRTIKDEMKRGWGRTKNSTTHATVMAI